MMIIVYRPSVAGSFVLLLFLLAIGIAATAMFRSRPAFAVRVVSYNVLSSHLASPSQFTTLDPEHLEASKRLPLVLKKIDEELSSSPKTIVCLQEVSYDWAAAFHTWFSNRGYHLITGLYGKKFNGYMGVALAYPVGAFETIDVDISRLSDKRVGGWPVEPGKTAVEALVSTITSVVSVPLKLAGFIKEPKEDHWAMSERRYNVLITATLRDKESGRSFSIGNYHMPCAYYMPMAMTIHAEMAARHVQSISLSKNGIPFILAGDWNITPNSATYKMMTRGELEKDDPSYPTPKHGMEWALEAAPMRSAYAEKGGEPNFTNYARVREDDPFIDTLDYIFLSKEWNVAGVKPIVHRDIAGGPFPNAKQPSDHILIYADLELE
jgi:mRNA deadenylase 3'-5' endonuclease subunit Ccr4